MKSIVEEVLSRFGTEDSTPTTDFRGSADDVELERVLASLKTNIKIIGCGGAGSNTINRCVEAGIIGAEFYAANTDAQHLLMIHSPKKILLGRRCTRGLGAGAIPEIGEEATREAEKEIKSAVAAADMVFITCGLGGGTGTGSAPIIAKLAREAGALTVAVCSMPFKAEGLVRRQNAEHGLEKLREVTDTVIVVQNDKLLELVPRLALNAAFRVADEVLMRAIKGITEIVTKPGLVNLDFNDIRTVMKEGGIAMIGMGEGDSEDRATEAVTEALNSPLIEVDIRNANGALINVTGGPDMTVSEAEKVAEIIQEKVSPTARIIWGAAIDPSLEHKLSVMLIITGVKSKQISGAKEKHLYRGDIDVVK